MDRERAEAIMEKVTLEDALEIAAAKKSIDFGRACEVIVLLGDEVTNLRQEISMLKASERSDLCDAEKLSADLRKKVDEYDGRLSNAVEDLKNAETDAQAAEVERQHLHKQIDLRDGTIARLAVKIGQKDTVAHGARAALRCVREAVTHEQLLNGIMHANGAILRISNSIEASNGTTRLARRSHPVDA